jgi:hypothetical protein
MSAMAAGTSGREVVGIGRYDTRARRRPHSFVRPKLVGGALKSLRKPSTFRALARMWRAAFGPARTGHGR